MGIFYKAIPATSIVRTVVVSEPTEGGNKPTIEWKQDSAPANPEQMVQEVTAIAAPPPAGRQFLWLRLVLAFALLAGIGAMIIYTAQVDKLAKFYEILLHAFEVLLGGLIGLLLGEGQNK